MRILYFIPLFFISLNINGQQLIGEKKIYNGKGVIFDSLATIHATFGNYQYRYTPKLDDIRLAEEILSTTLDDYKNQFKKYNRQYLGFVNEKNEKIILVNLLYFKMSKRKINNRYGNWKKEFVVGFGDFFDKYRAIYRVNLSTKSLNNE